jgi:hypothetical protein
MKGVPNNPKLFLDKRDIDIIKRMAKGERLCSIGESYGLTKERVRQLVFRAVANMKKNLESSTTRIPNYSAKELRSRGAFYVSLCDSYQERERFLEQAEVSPKSRTIFF